MSEFGLNFGQSWRANAATSRMLCSPQSLELRVCKFGYSSLELRACKFASLQVWRFEFASLEIRIRKLGIIEVWKSQFRARDRQRWAFGEIEHLAPHSKPKPKTQTGDARRRSVFGACCRATGGPRARPSDRSSGVVLVSSPCEQSLGVVLVSSPAGWLAGWRSIVGFESCALAPPQCMCLVVRSNH